jgi:hypothetical protein
VHLAAATGEFCVAERVPNRADTAVPSWPRLPRPVRQPADAGAGEVDTVGAENLADSQVLDHLVFRQTCTWRSTILTSSGRGSRLSCASDMLTEVQVESA